MIYPVKKPKNNALLPDIEAYLEAIDNNLPVSLQGLSGLVDQVTARTALSPEQAKIVTRLFFQEIRHAMLRNEEVNLRRLGNFSIPSPSTGTKIRVFPKFKPSPNLVKELNDK